MRKRRLSHVDEMQVTINDQVETFDGQLSVADLLARRQIEPVRVAVEINEDVVPRKTFAKTMISDGDQIEIVTFVGGG